MRVGLDTNILVYAEGVNGPGPQARATALMDDLDRVEIVVPAQAIAELFNVLINKAHQPRADAYRQVLKWRQHAEIADTNSDVLDSAIELAFLHRLKIWDALILAASAEAGCKFLLSEDMQDGFAWSGVTIVNPFAEPRSPLLDAALKP